MREEEESSWMTFKVCAYSYVTVDFGALMRRVTKDTTIELRTRDFSMTRREACAPTSDPQILDAKVLYQPADTSR